MKVIEYDTCGVDGCGIHDWTTVDGDATVDDNGRWMAKPQRTATA